jgi:hypothetical protein
MSARAPLAFNRFSVVRGALLRALVTASLLFAACGRSVHHDALERGAGAPGSVGGTGAAATGGTDGSAGATPSGDAGDSSVPTAGSGGADGQGGSDTGGAGKGAMATGGDATGGVATGGSSGAATGNAGAATGGVAPVQMIDGYGVLGAPLLFAPTATGFGVSVVVEVGDPSTLRVRTKSKGAWSDLLEPTVRAADLAEWQISGLDAGTTYTYEVLGEAGGKEKVLFSGTATTARAPGDSFTFALLSDTHIGSDLTFTNQGDTTLLDETSAQMGMVAPDFMVNLGDMLDYHEYGFNTPPPDSSVARAAYLNYRATYGDPLGSIPHFAVIGGWDSESGCNTTDEIERSRTQRLLYLPGPTPDTYPEGGSPFQDYYAFTWGDALFVMLNVYTYTPTCHLLDTYPGLPDDWTLGDAQMEWLRTTLENATSKWRFLMIHHPVGGNGGNDVDSAYGRGGGRAAHVGEQEIVHELMQQYGVQSFFYGHDHVFTDMVVDNIHYSLPGSAGAIWLFTTDETGYTDYWADSGWARVDVTPDSVHVQFLDVTGDLLYDYTLN